MSTAASLPVHDTEVLVVGAGPTGLMAALVLARRGIDVILVDPKPGPTRESRALVLQSRSLEILDQLDLAGPVLADSQPANSVRIQRESRPVDVGFAAAQSDDTPFPGARVFEQSRTEELLDGALAAAGRPPRYGHRLTDLPRGSTADDDVVEARIDGPDGPYLIRARHLLGADGASSPVRHLLGPGFTGVTDDATFCVADLRGIADLPDQALQTRFGDERFAVLFPLGPGGHGRLIWLHGSDTPAQEEALAAARDDLGLRYEGVEWFSAYRVHHRVADAFRVGPSFLAGDAAHVHSPVGGQGMNTGLQDAHHLANLLADVLRGRLEPFALDRYERERRPVALTLVRVTDRAFGVIARPGRGTALLRRRVRDVMSVLAPRLLATGAGPYLAGLLGQYRIHYREVPRGGTPPRWARDPAVGRRLRPTEGNREALRALDWQLHVYGGEAQRPAGLPAWIVGPLALTADPRGRLRPDRAYLIRPDGFVAAAWPLHAGSIPTADVREVLTAYGMVG